MIFRHPRAFAGFLVLPPVDGDTARTLSGLLFKVPKTVEIVAVFRSHIRITTTVGPSALPCGPGTVESQHFTGQTKRPLKRGGEAIAPGA